MGKKFVTKKSRKRFVIWADLALIGLWLMFGAVVILIRASVDNTWGDNVFMMSPPITILLEIVLLGIVVTIILLAESWIERGE